MSWNKKFNRSIATLMLILVFSISFSPIFAKKAEAFIFVDWVNFAVNAVTSFAQNSVFIKEFALDAVAWSVVNLMIEKMSASTVNWINSGFKGSPAFITNPEKYFQTLGDQVAGDFIYNFTQFDYLCSPIESKIRIALINNYKGRNVEWQCTLTDAVGNMEDFLDDFDRGGWDKFFEISQKPQNNPIGAYIMAENEFYSRLSQQLNLKERELQQGGGFLSFKKCARWEPIPRRAGESYSVLDAAMTVDTPAGPTNLGPATSLRCAETRTETPGSVIQSRLNDALGSGQERLQIADEINEIVGALLNQLATKALGGLFSLSRIGSDGEPAYTAQFLSSTTDSKITEYFDDSQDNVNDILNAPSYDPFFCRDNPTAPDCLPPPGDPNNQGDICLTNPSAEGCALNWNQGQSSGNP